MATLVLSAAGAAIGGAIGGTAAGLSAVAIGRFAGALVGNVLDQKIMGGGSRTVETGRIDRYRINGGGEGRAIPQVYGRMRVGGHVIWSSRFQEHVTSSGGGKGSSGGVQTDQFSYSVSLAVALCEGEITGVTRLWIDGRESAMSRLNMRVYPGDQSQLPDPKIEAVEGEGTVPAYRGVAYVVFEDLDLATYGNRIPQFSFEVSRASPADQDEASIEPTYATQAVALMPGTGEYALATDPVYYQIGPAQQRAANLNAPSGQTDFLTSLDALQSELPNCGAVSLIVSWFGDDLRCGHCEIRPKVEDTEIDGSLPWQVAGLGRSAASQIAQIDGRPVYGGTPSDASVIQAIAELNARGLDVMFYPFILMDQLEGNGLADPWSDALDQAVLPWRGRITLSEAPGRAASPDGTALAEQQVADFFGTASAADFTINGSDIVYSGPQEWRYRRFILHQAALCAAAGGVHSFCIGSEMRSLTWIRGAAGQFEAVAQLIALAAEVRAILGPDVKLSYAADWSEYFGYQPTDGSGDRYFHLDALWADQNIDFIGIDNYMPLSDWREGEDHADAAWSSVYDLEYLKANIEGGEGYDWYYHSTEAEEAQIRTPIEDGAHGEPWVYRYKDIRNWWANTHHDRVDGVREAEASPWVPQSKPIVFTELGCAAIDKGANQPNKFLDPKSSESSLPKYSDGRRDEYIQQQYLKAMYDYWGNPVHNPISSEYGGRMIDMSRAFVWAWDARPYPRFPNERTLWSDGDNYARGHWLTGRSTHRTLASVVRQICERAGVTHFDVSGLHGVVRGYAVDEVSEPRQALQPLMLQYGFDAVERDGVLRFVMRGGKASEQLDLDGLVDHAELENTLERLRAAEAESTGRVRLNFVQAGADFDVVSEEAILPDETTHAVGSSEVALSLLRAEGRQCVERWLAESQVARDTLRFALPPSMLHLGAGDVVELPGPDNTQEAYRIDRVEIADAQICEAVRIERSIYDGSDYEDEAPVGADFVPAVPVQPLFMDLPLLTGDETPHAPHLAVVADPWPGTVAVYESDMDANYALSSLVPARSTVGVLQSPLAYAPSGRIDRGAALEVRMISGTLESVAHDAMLNGANVAAIGDGTPDNWEIIQFETADLVAPDTYHLTNRLRGLLGSDALGVREWPAGSWFVRLDGIPEQMNLAANTRGRERHYRIGPAAMPYDDASYVYHAQAFAGIGLRPYAPVHLKATQDRDDVAVSWIRRTRIDGDRWTEGEVPLGEESEAYRVQVYQGQSLLREDTVASPEWTYSQSAMNSDDASGLVEIRVAQISARFGAGLDGVTTVNLP
jgi:hypothetical protein